MPRFFKEDILTAPFLDGADGAHVARSLRMRRGDTLVVCNTAGVDCLCEIIGFAGERVELRIVEQRQTDSEPSLQVTLFQCLPKLDKMDGIVRRAVELGVTRVVPVLSARCVSRPTTQAAAKKRERWQRIADEAAGQCGRGILPEVAAPVPFAQGLEAFGGCDAPLFCYECGGIPLREAARTLAQAKTCGVFIGPEGGFALEERDAAVQAGGCPITLGRRILRTETAPLAAVAAVMLLSGNLE